MSDPRLWTGDDWHEIAQDVPDTMLSEFAAAIEEICDAAEQGNWDAVNVPSDLN